MTTIIIHAIYFGRCNLQLATQRVGNFSSSVTNAEPKCYHPDYDSINTNGIDIAHSLQFTNEYKIVNKGIPGFFVKHGKIWKKSTKLPI